jgi:hypothetical protein
MFSLGMCHKHILQQEKQLYKIVKDPLHNSYVHS